MALVLKTVYKGYYWIFEDLADPRPKELNLLWMSSPIKPTLLISFYLYFTYNLGPKIMANRRPFELKNVMILYNAFQVFINSFIVYEAMQEILFNINWDCAPIEYTVSPRALYVLKVYHLFFLIKAADLLDTVFFVLRKKDKQITFLHVYHHFGMFGMTWVSVKFFGGGASVFVGAINGAVHAVMYTYYLLTAVDKKWKQSVTFKRTLTQIQIIQFILFIIIYGRLLFKPDCAFPKFCSYVFVPQNCFMLALFGDFYRRTYISEEKTPIEVTQNVKNVSYKNNDMSKTL